MKKTAVAYTRVSSAEQLREGFSIAAQKRLLADYAAAQGYAVVAWFEDDETAKSTGRPGFAAMVEYLADHADCALLVEKTDRLYRNLRDYIDLDTLGTEIHFVKEGGKDRRDSDSRFMHLIRVGMARKYVENLSEEVKKGMRQKCVEGGWPTWAPLGYRQVTETEEKKRTGGIVPDPETAPIVRELFEAAAEGASLGSLAKMAQRAGLRGARGGTVAKQQLSKILRAPVYYGETRWGGETYRGKYEPLIDRETWERANRALSDASKPKTRAHRFTYGALSVCGDCAGRLSGDVKKGRFVYYSCRCSRARGLFYPERMIDAAMSSALRRLALPAEARDRVLEQLERWHERDTSRDEVRVGRIRRRLTELANLHAAAYEEKLLGKVAEPTFLALEARWRAEESELRRELETLQAAVSRVKLIAAAREPFELLEVAARQYLSRNSEERAAMVKTCVSNLTISDGNVSVRWASPFDLMEKLGDRQGWLAGVDAFRTYLISRLVA